MSRHITIPCLLKVAKGKSTLTPSCNPIYNVFKSLQGFKYFSTTTASNAAAEKKLHPLNLSGIYPPIVTPFDDTTFQISFEKLEANLKKWNSAPFAGYVILGSNGESVSLRMKEKLALVKQARKLCMSSHLVIAGTGCQGTEETIEFCQNVANDKSADAALVITPSYFKDRMTDLALRKHFEEVADKSPIPVILYNVPKNTNLDMSAELVADLSRHPNIIGLKESGGDITKISRITYLTKENDFQVLAGSAGFLLPALLMGCVGGICALANVLPEETCQLYKLATDNDLVSAVSLQQRLVYPNLLVTGKLGVAGLKKSMDLAGYYGGPCRLPLLPLGPSEVQILKDGFAKEKYFEIPEEDELD